jgi:broad specificity phosphatase PhoE
MDRPCTKGQRYTPLALLLIAHPRILYYNIAMKLLLIRHGQSIANAEGRLQGQFDSPLTDLGREQARALARRLLREGWAVSALYASDLSRAAETAEILATRLDATVTLDERLREYDVGVLNGVIWHEIEFLYPEIWHDLHHSNEWVPIPEEEGNEAFHARLVAALADIRASHGEGEVVGVVSHGGSLGMILAHLLSMETRRPTPFRFGNASLSVVEFRANGPVLSCLNDTCHMDGNLR